MTRNVNLSSTIAVSGGTGHSQTSSVLNRQDFRPWDSEFFLPSTAQLPPGPSRQSLTVVHGSRLTSEEQQVNACSLTLAASSWKHLKGHFSRQAPTTSAVLSPGSQSVSSSRRGLPVGGCGAGSWRGTVCLGKADQRETSATAKFLVDLC